MPTASVDDATLYYECDGAGPAILFVHGMCGDADVWADQADRLAAHDTCVRHDRRGYCRSSRGEAPLSVARHADDAAALIETLELAPCLLVGSSSGAVIALDVACRHGHLLRGVVRRHALLYVEGELQSESRVINLVAHRIRPLTEVCRSVGGPGQPEGVRHMGHAGMRRLG